MTDDTNTPTVQTVNGGVDGLDTLLASVVDQARQQALDEHTCDLPVAHDLMQLREGINRLLPDGATVNVAIDTDADGVQHIVAYPSGFRIDETTGEFLTGFQYDPEATVTVDYEVTNLDVDDFTITADQLQEILTGYGMDDYVRDAAVEELHYADFVINIGNVSRAHILEDVEVSINTDVEGEAEFTVEQLVEGFDFADEAEFTEALRDNAAAAIAAEFAVSDDDVLIVSVDVR